MESHANTVSGRISFLVMTFSRCKISSSIFVLLALSLLQLVSSTTSQEQSFLPASADPNDAVKNEGGDMYWCSDSSCRSAISAGRTLVVYNAPTHRHLSFNANQDIVILGKPVHDGDFWIGKVYRNGRAGLVPKRLIREEKMLNQKEKHDMNLDILLLFANEETIINLDPPKEEKVDKPAEKVKEEVSTDAVGDADATNETETEQEYEPEEGAQDESDHDHDHSHEYQDTPSPTEPGVEEHDNDSSHSHSHQEEVVKLEIVPTPPSPPMQTVVASADANSSPPKDDLVQSEAETKVDVVKEPEVLNTPSEEIHADESNETMEEIKVVEAPSESQQHAVADSTGAVAEESNHEASNDQGGENVYYQQYEEQENSTLEQQIEGAEVTMNSSVPEEQAPSETLTQETQDHLENLFKVVQDGEPQVESSASVDQIEVPVTPAPTTEQESHASLHGDTGKEELALNEAAESQQGEPREVPANVHENDDPVPETQTPEDYKEETIENDHGQIQSQSDFSSEAEPLQENQQPPSEQVEVQESEITPAAVETTNEEIPAPAEVAPRPEPVTPVPHEAYQATMSEDESSTTPRPPSVVEPERKVEQVMEEVQKAQAQVDGTMPQDYHHHGHEGHEHNHRHEHLNHLENLFNYDHGHIHTHEHKEHDHEHVPTIPTEPAIEIPQPEPETVPSNPPPDSDSYVHHHHHHHDVDPTFSDNEATEELKNNSFVIVVKYLSSTLLSFLPEHLQDTILDVNDALVFTGIIVLLIIGLCVPYFFVETFLSSRPLKKKVVDLNKALWKVSAAYENQQDEFDAFKTKAFAYDECLSKIEKLETQLEIKRKLDNKQKLEVQNLKEELKRRVGLELDVEALVQSTLTKLDKITLERDKHSSAAKNFKTSFEEATEKLEMVQTELNSKTMDVELLKSAKEFTENKVKASENEISELKSKLTNEIASRRQAQDKIDELETTRSDLQEELSNLRKITLQYESTVADLTTEISLKENELFALKDSLGDDSPLVEIAEITAKLSIAEKEAKSLQSRIDSITLEKNTLSRNVEESSTALKTITAEKDEAQKKLHVLEKYFKEKEEELRKIVEKQQVEQEIRGKDKNELIHLIQEKTCEINDFKERIEQLKLEFEETKNQHRSELRAKDSKNHEQWLALCQSERKVKDAKEEADSYRLKLTQLAKERGDENDTLMDGEEFFPVIPPPPLDDNAFHHSPVSYFGLGIEPPPPLPDDDEINGETRRSSGGFEPSRPNPLGSISGDSESDDVNEISPIVDHDSVRGRGRSDYSDGSASPTGRPLSRDNWMNGTSGRVNYNNNTKKNTNNNRTDQRSRHPNQGPQSSSSPINDHSSLC